MIIAVKKKGKKKLEKKKPGCNAIRTRALCDIGAMLYRLPLSIRGHGFQSKRFHDLETASKTTFREPANFAPDRF